MSVPMTIEGDVVAVHSYWTDDRSRIETDATIQTVDGQQVVVNQFGGAVDGIAMIQMPGERILEVGMHVVVAAHTGLDLQQHEHIGLDSVKIVQEAEGFVRTGPTADGGHYLYWPGTSTDVVLDSHGTSALSMAQTQASVDAAINEWNNKTVSCSYFKLNNAGTRSFDAVTGDDRINVIKFHDQPCMCDPTVGTMSWGCRPATMNSMAKCYAREAAAITTATFFNGANSSKDGQIVDADVELNGVDFAISANGMTNTPGLCLADLQNTLTHELGHLHGLEHTCLAPGDPPRVDNLGNPVPSCSAVQANPSTPANMKIIDATMYNYQQCGETSKSSLSDDDIQAICTIYDINKPPGAGCCSASRGSDRPAGALLLAGLVGLWMRRRRTGR